MITYADLFGGQIVQFGSESYRLKYTFGSQCVLSELGVDTNDPDTMRDPNSIAKLIWAGMTPKDRTIKTWKDVREAMPLNAVNDLVNKAVALMKDAFIVETDQTSKKKLN